jgi:translation initiation factor IF-2
MVQDANQKENTSPVLRPPVVVVLGHVDAGKTSILDFIRKTRVAEKESGGITQHVGAYEVEVGNPPSPKATEGQRKIVFIDTPGHEAFSAMRSRGAKVADIAVLVVDAVAGIQSQTKEAISHIKKAGVSLLVVINKIDLPSADPEKIKRDLVKEGVTVEALGGQIPCAEVSAASGVGIDHLLELILLLAEMENLQADLEKPAEGVIIESSLDSSVGVLATIILKQGLLRPGEVVATATALGKIRGLENFQGRSVIEAQPSLPVVVFGFEAAPQVGDKLRVFSSRETASAYLEKKEKKAAARPVVFIEEGKKVLNLILKADTLGSLEAVEEVLVGLPQDKVALRVLSKGVGEIHENDVKLAAASKAAILGFRVKISPAAQILKEKLVLKIAVFEIIYTLAQAARQLMENQLGVEVEKKILGKVKVLALFLSEKTRQIVGGKVIEGEVKKGAKIEVWRQEQSLGRGRLVSLQENKKDAVSVPKGRECGILFEGGVKIETDDLLEVFEQEQKKTEL